MPLVESIESNYLTWESEQRILTPKSYILNSLVPPAKHYNETLEEDVKKIKITCQSCNGFITCPGRNVELLYINFLRDGMSTIGIYPDDLVRRFFPFIVL